MLIRFLLIVIILSQTPNICFAQMQDKINPKYFTGQWEAYWITHPDSHLYDYGVFHFRKSFQITDISSEFIINVSADNRYRLFVNGEAVCHGPARGDFSEWFYETIDIGPFLIEGKNTIAAMVWNAGEHRPKAQVSDKTAFIVQGNSVHEQIVNTGTGWKVIENKAFTPILYKDIDERLFKQYYVAGPLDSVVAKLYPWGWEDVNFNDDNWSRIRLLNRPSREHTYHQKWTMEPRHIPMLTSEYQRLKKVARTSVDFNTEKFITGNSSITIPPNSSATILFDNTFQTNGYPELKVSDGKNSLIKIRYAETFILPGLKKEHRDSLQAELIGVNDVFIPNGENGIVFRPLWTRTFRWLQLEIETGAQPLVLEDLQYEYSAYPTKIIANFNSNDPMLTKIWDASIRTQILSAQETFVSDLYWEQMQYLGDTKVQGLAYLLMTGDEILYKLALEQFDNSRIPCGLTQSRHPGDLVQVIPLYSLVWVTMMHDYMMYGKDPEYVRQFIPGMLAVLNWFENQLTENNLLPKLPYWNFIDWAYMPRYEEIMSQAGNPELSIHTMLYSYTLKQAEEIFHWAGEDYHAKRFKEIRTRVNNSVKSRCFDEKKGLYVDTPSSQLYSQHTNLLAVLAGIDEKDKQKEIMQKVISDPELVAVDMYFHFFLGRAIKKSGLGNDYLKTIEPWKGFINLGMTTFGEAVKDPRSECHAWSTGPAFEFLSTVCGVESRSPGFKKIEIAPHPGELEQIQGTIAHPNGLIKVNLSKGTKDNMIGTIEIPNNTSGEYIYNGKSIMLVGGQTTKIK